MVKYEKVEERFRKMWRLYDRDVNRLDNSRDKEERIYLLRFVPELFEIGQALLDEVVRLKRQHIGDEEVIKVYQDENTRLRSVAEVQHTPMMWEVGVEGDKFNPHVKNPGCAEAGCVPMQDAGKPHGVQKSSPRSSKEMEDTTYKLASTVRWLAPMIRDLLDEMRDLRHDLRTALDREETASKVP